MHCFQLEILRILMIFGFLEEKIQSQRIIILECGLQVNPLFLYYIMVTCLTMWLLIPFPKISEKTSFKIPIGSFAAHRYKIDPKDNTQNHFWGLYFLWFVLIKTCQKFPRFILLYLLSETIFSDCFVCPYVRYYG